MESRSSGIEKRSTLAVASLAVGAVASLTAPKIPTAPKLPTGPGVLADPGVVAGNVPKGTAVAQQLAAGLRHGPAGQFLTRLLDGDRAARRAALGTLAVFSLALTGAAILSPDLCPPSALVFPLILGGPVLRTRQVLGLIGGVALCLTADGLLRVPHGLTPGSASVVAGAAALVLLNTRFRARHGLPGPRGDTILMELSERTRALGRMPAGLPDWQFHQVLAPADGTLFSGDFLLSSHRPDRDLLEVVLVDVSGKGSRAAARSMHLSGAFAILLGSVPSEAFLPTANDYLHRLGWDDAFATAIHLALRPSDGAYRIFNAGHPPAVQYSRAGHGSWRRVHEGAPALGLLPGTPYPAAHGSLAPGDALLLYSDGLVEVRGEDIDHGIDRLLAASAPVLRHGGPEDPAQQLLRTVSRQVADDRTLVVVRRLGAGA